jgi:2-polyprenyl-6-methoxyphenol hydroxylase-like FAD-dependent oxidoreductase
MRFMHEAIIVGRRLGGLVTAHDACSRAASIARFYEQADAIRELGVGINTLPHAIKELKELGLLSGSTRSRSAPTSCSTSTASAGDLARAARHRARASTCRNSRSTAAGCRSVIYQAARGRGLGESRFHFGGAARAASTQDEGGVTSYFFDRRLLATATARGDVLIGADGIHSFVRDRLFPNEGPPAWNGLMLWRGATDWPAISSPAAR